MVSNLYVKVLFMLSLTIWSTSSIDRHPRILVTFQFISISSQTSSTMTLGTHSFNLGHRAITLLINPPYNHPKERYRKIADIVAKVSVIA